MGTCSSGEDLVVKARKPYTITKQREKWTEEEQNKFLEALKLYGRAWQSIEEHIGTKTAVQIRSHAQKFFSKLEKEAVAKGIPLGDVHDIQIPPPRPKRKPNKPYPRKICDGVVSSYVERKDGRRTSFSSLCSKRTTDLELSDHNEKHARNQRLERTKDISIDNKCSESLSYFQWEGKTPVDASVSEEFVLSDKPKDDEDNLIVKENVQDDKYMDIGSLYRLSIDTEVKLTEERKISQKQLRNCRMPMRNEVGSSKNYPKHVPVHSIDEHNNGSVENRSADATNVTSISDKVEVHTSLNFGTIPCISAAAELNNSSSVSSVQRPFATFPPFMQFLGTQDACRSSSNISSTFSSLIISTLVQNPAVHSAASLAASFCPTADIETPIGSASGTFVGGIPMGHTNPSPSMAAIAAATVAAASAWWGTHGMLPFYHPFQSCFAFAPAPTNTIPRTETTQTTEDNEGREVEVAHGHLPINQQNVDPQCSEALGTKSADPLSSLVSDDDQERGMAHAVQQKSPAHNHPNSSPDSHLPESIKARSKKKVDHSSCGSNAFTNSEMEKGKVLKNLEEGKGEPTDVNLTHPSSMDISNHRPRGNIINMSESWKEVSEEGRLAFQALFSRDILPQSFSLAHTEGVMKNRWEEVVAPPAELNSDACAPAGNCHAHVADRNCSSHEGIKIGKDSLNNGIRGEGKLKSHRTGFKPYKRCSMEAKENKGEPGEEKCNKRIHLEGKTSM